MLDNLSPDALTLDDRTNIALETLDSFELGATSYLKGVERTIREQGFGATDDARVLIQKHITETTALVAQHKVTCRTGKQADGVRAFLDALDMVDDDVVALVALQVGLTAVAEEMTVAQAYLSLGRAIEAEMYAAGLRGYDKKLALRLEKAAKTRRGSMDRRRDTVKAIAAKNGFTASDWTDDQRATAGKWMVELMLLGDVFVLSEDQEFVTITEEALAYSQEMTKHLLEAHPVPLPLLTPPSPWTGIKNTITCNGRGYEIPLLRRTCKVTRAVVTKAIKEGKLQPVFDALNAIQNTAWSINAPIMEMIRWAYDNDVSVSGLPRRTKIDIDQALRDRGWPVHLTTEEYEALSEQQRGLRSRVIRSLAEKNKGLVGERMTLERDLTIARLLSEKGDEFYTPYNMDYRGRVYSVSYFGFQRQDYVRAMFQFKEGKPLGERGLYWLKVHIANCGDFDKVSKKPFGQRINWVDGHSAGLIAIGKDPKAVQWWTEADSPFLFLAACQEYARAMAHPEGPESYVCRIPVSFDGTCSGLQHFAGMTRCLDTATLVNVAPVEKPQDVYQAVADKVRVVVEEHAKDGEFADVARLALSYGIDRSLVKRNVMTYSYSSPKFGMITQQMDDTMRPLSDKVLEGKLTVHPFEVPEDTYEDKEGNWRHMPGKKAGKFLGSIVFDTIEQTVVKPAEAMHFLQNIAKTLAHEGKPVIWNTPMGLPVVLRYPNQTTKSVCLYLSNRGVKVRTRMNLSEEGPGIDKRAASNAVAPSFVHSMDACHLQMVCKTACDNGITSMALVHDSFGCLPADADDYREIIRGEFHRLYDQHDVLADILAEAHEQIETNHHRLPELPSKGALDIHEVLKADYAFA